MSVGAGLLTTLQVDTGEGKWIGYQVLYGIGLGLCFQVPNLAAQTVLPKNDVTIGLSLMLFESALGCSGVRCCWRERIGQPAFAEAFRAPWIQAQLGYLGRRNVSA